MTSMDKRIDELELLVDLYSEADLKGELDDTDYKKLDECLMELDALYEARGLDD